MKMNIFDVDFVILANKKICDFHGHTHICSQPEKIESALHSALFPGNFPFVHGGVVEIGAAIFYYIIKTHAFFDGNKRTAVICAISFLESNGWSLKYPISKERNDLAQIADDCAANIVNLEELKIWFQNHKINK